MKQHRAKTGLQVRREPAGRLQRERQEPPPAKLRRLYLAALAGMEDARWATELGRLYRGQKISEVEFLAGERWAMLARQYAHAIEAPTIKPPALERTSKGTRPDNEHAMPDNEHAIRAMRKPLAALQASGALAVVRAACEYERCITYELPQLRTGLDALAKHWRLSGTKTNGKLSKPP